MHKQVLIVISLISLISGSVSFADRISGRDDIYELRSARDRNERTHTDTEILVKYRGAEKFTEIPTRGERVEDLVARYRGNRDVEYAEPNVIVEAYAPNDPYYSYQWNLHNSLGGIRAESLPATGAGTVVAVLDTGIAYENYTQSSLTKYYLAPDLAGTTFVSGYDFINGDTHANDDNGHGTHVAGTIAQSTNNALGAAGVAPQASLMPVKVLDRRGTGTASSLANGIRFAADNGAHVINLSLGSRTGSTAIRDALAYAHGKGVIIIAATGNDGLGSLSYPAAYNEYVIAVGATRRDETRAPYSNYGTGIDVVAPGGDLNVDQNGDGYGDGILQQTFSGATNNWGYYFFQGTSMATPHVSGVAALLLSQGVAASSVRNALESTAKDLGVTGYDTTYGHGLIQADSALGASPPPPPEPEPEPEPVSTILFADSFESGLGGWTQDSQRDWSRSSSRRTDGSYSAEVDGSANAASLSAQVSNPSPSSVRLSFDWWIDDTLDGGEYLSLEVSINNGAWTEVARLRGNVDPEDTWHAQQFEFANVSTIQIRFKGSMSASTEDAYVDRVSVERI